MCICVHFLVSFNESPRTVDTTTALLRTEMHYGYFLSIFIKLKLEIKEKM